jgi:NAD(P)-dependent dehydrogenase (short-subunit alcohol dehydrogenase family)
LATLCLAEYHSTKDEGFSKVLTLNLQRVFTLIQKLLPLLRAGAAQSGKTGAVYNDPARIINVSTSAMHLRASPSIDGPLF